MTSTGDQASSASNRSLREAIGGLLFYIGIPAVTLYPLGFVALSLQLWRDPDFPYAWASSGLDFAMSWYAASLVPKVVVIGTGVRLLFVSVLSTFLSMAVASITLYLLPRLGFIKGGAKEQEPEDYYGGRVYLRGWERYLWFVSLIIVLPMVAVLLSTGFPFDSWYDAIFYGAYFVFSACGGVLIGYIRSRGHHKFWHHGLLVAFAGAIFGALSLSALELPDLPFVEIEANTSWPEELAGTQYRVLSNDSQHWYVYNRESGMLALDQADVKSVRFWDATEERPSEISPRQDGRVNPG